MCVSNECTLVSNTHALTALKLARSLSHCLQFRATLFSSSTTSLPSLSSFSLPYITPCRFSLVVRWGRRGCTALRARLKCTHIRCGFPKPGGDWREMWRYESPQNFHSRFLVPCVSEHFPAAIDEGEVWGLDGDVLRVVAFPSSFSFYNPLYLSPSVL